MVWSSAWTISGEDRATVNMAAKTEITVRDRLVVDISISFVNICGENGVSCRLVPGRRETLGQSTLPGWGLAASSWHALSIRLSRMHGETQRGRIGHASGTRAGPG